MGYTTQKTTEKVPPLVVGSDQPLVELGPPLVELDCSHQPYVPSNWQLMLLFLPIASAAHSSSRVLLAGGGRKFDVEAASAAAPITDTVLGRNSSDTLLEDGSGVISGEITGGKASEKADEVI